MSAFFATMEISRLFLGHLDGGLGCAWALCVHSHGYED